MVGCHWTHALQIVIYRRQAIGLLNLQAQFSIEICLLPQCNLRLLSYEPLSTFRLHVVDLLLYSNFNEPMSIMV